MKRTPQQIEDTLKLTLRAFPSPVKGKPGKARSSAQVVDEVTAKHPTIKPDHVKAAIKQLAVDGFLLREGVGRNTVYHRPAKAA